MIEMWRGGRGAGPGAGIEESARGAGVQGGRGEELVTGAGRERRAGPERGRGAGAGTGGARGGAGAEIDIGEAGARIGEKREEDPEGGETERGQRGVVGEVAEVAAEVAVEEEETGAGIEE